MEKSPVFNKAYIWPFVLVTTLFFLWGIPNNLNDVLIKQFMKSFEINRFKAGLVQSAFYLGYFLLAIPAGLFMKKYSYKTGLVLGLFLFGTGCLLFYPAAQINTYGFFLFALFVIASGLAFLETGANPFIARFGNPETAERRLNFSQAFNPLGSISGVLIGTVFIFSGIEHDQATINTLKQAGTYDSYLHQETLRVTTPYMVIGIFVILWGLLMLFSKFPTIADDEKNNTRFSLSGLFKYGHFIKGVIAQFFYVGAQVGTWSFFIQYVQDYTGQPEKTAGFLLIGTLVAFAIGRFSATYLMKFIAPGKLMGIYSIINMLLVSAGILFSGWIGMIAILLTSFFMSLMFPTIFALGIKGLGQQTKLGGSLIVMAIIGGAFWTPVMGYISVKTGSMALAFIVPLLAYLYISYYSFVGSKPDEKLLSAGQ